MWHKKNSSITTSQSSREELEIKVPFDKNFPLLMQSARARASKITQAEKSHYFPIFSPLHSLTRTTDSLLANSQLSWHVYPSITLLDSS